MLPPKPTMKPDQIYHITFEEYLQPKKRKKNLPQHKKLILCAEHVKMMKQKQKQAQKQERLSLKLLEHPALQEARMRKWRSCYERLKKKACCSRTKVQNNATKSNKWQQYFEKFKQSPFKAETKGQLNEAAAKQNKWQKCCEIIKRKSNESKVEEFKINAEEPAVEEAARIKGKFADWKKLLKLPNFLAFLRARNDDGLCKRKSGFEIYCEMASIHGFVNFVDAKTWQRVFWCLIIGFAVLMSIIILVMSHLLNLETPTILYTESNTNPAWTIPFPAITLCNLNRISKSKAELLAQKFTAHTNLSVVEILQLFRLSLYNTDQLDATFDEYRTLEALLEHNNYTLTQFMLDISPDCGTELLRCKWKGRNEPCAKLWRKAVTPHGLCCSFNYHVLQQQLGYQDKLPPEVQHITSCGYKNGLTLLLEPNSADYMASSGKIVGYQLLLHGAHDFPVVGVERRLARSRSETTFSITPRTTYSTDYLHTEPLKSRRCYLPQERQLYAFHKYTHSNCLAECRSAMLYEKCRCVPPFWPRKSEWPVCNLTQSECVLANHAINSQVVTERNMQYGINHRVDNFICDCWPECDFNHYTSLKDTSSLDRNFTMGDKRFFKDITLKNHILLHIFYGDLVAEKLRLDVSENWLSFVGTFGGITGLHMGYSVVSGFELIFFVFVRPACNWLTKKQIRYRIKRRQKKAAAAAAAAKKEQEAKPATTNEV